MHLLLLLPELQPPLFEGAPLLSGVVDPPLFCSLFLLEVEHEHTHTERFCTELISHLQGCVQELPNNYTGLILTFCSTCFCFLEGGGFSSDDDMISTPEPQTGETVRPKPDFMQTAAKTWSTVKAVHVNILCVSSVSHALCYKTHQF